ncbi:MCE family protein [Paracoccus subflavus]|uniref:MCE family protein n=1 Tax=Paracoccus subflavus TaxID=2528244 RepID=A0A4V2JCA3_9RHOB|nr:MlaD family protein [Paracoccus subflavus]TBN40393.1 MCE family protein [Paracoccus subflavus]
MTDTPPPKPASPVRKSAARAAQAGLNVIWLVPILALLVTLAIAWNAYSTRGDIIEVEFMDATGVTPGETALRFREITVGQVESVRFTSDLSRVLVSIRVDKDVAPYIDSDAAFWIVRPQVTAQGVSRLDTVLTGSFIEGYWDAEISGERSRFDGQDRPPLVRTDTPGTWVTLTMENADGITDGAPVLYRGVQVGRMENLRLSEAEDQVIADAFIESPHDQRLTSSTVFWDTSGFSLSLGASGVSFNVNSLSSLLQGGVSFDTLISGGQPIQPGHTFVLQPDEDTARNDILASDNAAPLRISMLIDDSLRGLSKGAEVQFQGLRVGQVTDLAVTVDNGTDRARQIVTLAISPFRLGLADDATPEEGLAFLQEAVAQGLRARVASAGFLGTSLMVELVDIPNAAPAQINMDADPHPIIPSVPGDLDDFSASAQDFLTRIGDLPFEAVLDSATNMMNSITTLASSEDTRAIPESLRQTLDQARGAATDIGGMARDLRDAGTSENLARLIDEAAAAAEAVRLAAAAAPAMVEQIDAAAAAVGEFDFAAVSTQVETLLADLRTILGSEEAAQLPRTLSETLQAALALLNGLREGGAAENLARLIDEAAAAAQAVRLAAVDAPAMVDQIDAAAAAVEQFNFADISAQAEGILADLRAMLGSEDAEQLPRNLSDTLEAASGLLNDLREGGAAGNLNDALDSASTAADQVAASVERLPQLIARLEATAARADSVLASYGDRSAFNTEAVNMLRELRRATEAFGSLARMIERNPRAFILGR